MKIEDIETDEELVKIIDELKHRIKGGIRKNGKYTNLQSDFNEALDTLIRYHSQVRYQNPS